MGAHRRRIIRQRSAANSRKRGGKSSDTASLDGDYDDGSSLGSWESAETAGSSAEHRADSRTSGLSRGTLIRHHSATNNGDSGADRGNNGRVRTTIGNTGDQPPAVLPPYHPDAECSEMMGYAGRLSSSHEAALGGLRQWLTRESVDLTPLLGDGKNYPPEEEDLALMRFLRRNAWDVELTRAQLEASLSWRVETGVASATRREPWEVSGCASEESFEQLCKTHYPHYTLGTDRVGRPVLVQKYGNFDTSSLQEFTTLAGLLRYHVWEQEKNAELLRRATARTGYLVETYVMIMDFKGMSAGQVNRDFLWLLRELGEIDRNHYPGRGGVIYVINTPPLFGLVWQGIRGFLATQARVHFFGKEKEWKPALAEAIDLAVLPLEYGGTALPLVDTPFLPAVHRALELGVTAVATSAVAATDTQAGEDVPTGSKEDVTARSMCSLLRCFSSLDGGGGHCKFERHVSFNGNGDGSGGGIPFSMGHGLGSSGGGFKSGGGGGGALCLASTSGGETGRREGRGCDIAYKDVPEQEGVRGKINEDDNTASKTKRSAPSQGRTSSGTPSDNAKSAPLRSITLRPPPLEAAASVVALPASDDPRAAAASSSSSSHVVIVGQQCGNNEGCNDNGQEDDDDHHGDLEWVLDVVPGARLAAKVAGTVAGAALGATLGVAGFAAGVVEAVVPGQVWAEGVQAFQSAQFMGGWALGH